MHKVITFGIPSYNAAKDMDHCITSVLMMLIVNIIHFS